MREFIFSTYDKRFNLDKAGKAYSIANCLRHIRYQMLSSCNTGDSRLYFGYGDSRSYFLVLPLKSWVPVYFKLRSAPMENSGIPLQFNCEVVQLAYFCFFLCMHAYVLLVFYVCMPIFFIVRDCQFPSVMLVINILFFFEVVLGLDTDVTWWILNKKLSRALTLWQPDDMHVYWKSKIWCLSVNTKKKKRRGQQ